MELRTAMRTTPATRAFTDDDLPPGVLLEILEHARFAPSGGGREAWHVIVVRDKAVQRQIAELYELGFREYFGFHRAGLVPFVASEAHWRNPPEGPADPAIDLAEARTVPLPEGREPTHLVDAPVLLVITLDLDAVSAVDSGLGRVPLTAGASAYPFAHNILLAARDAGYGGHLTSVLARQEPALKELLHLPANHALATMVPLGKPVREVTKLKRRPVEEFATIGTFDGPAFDGTA